MQLSLDLGLGRLVAQLKAQLLVSAIDPLTIDGPSLPLEQHGHPPMAVADPGLRDGLAPRLQGDGILALSLLVIA